MTDDSRHILEMCGRSSIIFFYFVIFITGAYILIARNYINRQINGKNKLFNFETFGDNEGFNVCQEFVHKEVELKNINISRYCQKIFVIFSILVTPTQYISLT